MSSMQIGMGIKEEIMQNGAFALIDCLGFRGLWRNGREQLIAKLRLINENLENPDTYDLIVKDVSKHNVQVKLLSDTIAIGVSSKTGDGDKINDLITLTGIVMRIMDIFLGNEPHILLRGCITHGEYLTEKNFLVGPAVDKTAEFMESAEGSFVWFLPQATSIIDEFCESKVKSVKEGDDVILRAVNAFMPKFEVPIKNSHFLKSRLVNPIYNKMIDESELVIAKTKKVMDVDTMSVWMKRQHTLEFLDMCKDANAKLHELTIVG